MPADTTASGTVSLLRHGALTIVFLLLARHSPSKLGSALASFIGSTPHRDRLLISRPSLYPLYVIISSTPALNALMADGK